MLFNDLVNIQEHEERESVEPTLTSTHTIVVDHSTPAPEAREILITLLATLDSQH